jgi:hypothetical protein
LRQASLANFSAPKLKDLVLLVPDKNTQFALQGALRRPKAMGIRPIEFDFRSHPGRDGGVRSTGTDLLSGEHQRFKHALMVFDRDGSGSPAGQSATDLEQELDARLNLVWGGKAKVIVIEPEVDIWLWGSENIMRDLLNWHAPEGIRPWLAARGHQFDPSGKPTHPKDAVESLVRFLNQPRSSALYEKITSRISLHRCTDASFLRVRAVLRNWFPSVT